MVRLNGIALGILVVFELLLTLVVPVSVIIMIYRYLMVRYLRKKAFHWGFLQVAWSLVPLLLSLIFLVIGYFTFEIREDSNSTVHYETMAAILLCSAACLVILIFNIIKGYHLVFQLENIIIWSSFTVGWAIAEGSMWEDLVFSTIGICIVTGFIGGFVQLIASLFRKEKFVLIRALIKYLNGLLND